MKTCTKKVIVWFVVIAILVAALARTLYVYWPKKQNPLNSQTKPSDLSTELTELSSSSNVFKGDRAEQLLRQLLVSR